MRHDETKTGDFRDVLACPYCNGPLSFSGDTATCPHDRVTFPVSETGAIDFRPTRPKSIPLTYEIGTDPEQRIDSYYHQLRNNPSPETDLYEAAKRGNLSREEATYIPRAKSKDSIALDVGCGAMPFREMIEAAGFRYIGIDIGDPGAMYLGDAHALPIADGSVEFVFANAMLQYTKNPFVVIDEIQRVLTDDGTFLGTAAFLEGFDGHSCFFTTKNGIVSLLEHGRFDIEFLSPDPGWTGFSALNKVSFFPGLPTPVYNVLATPYRWLSFCWWQLIRLKGKTFRREDWLSHTTAAFIFRVRKRGDGTIPAE